jgi:hypothetical protein
MELSKAVVECVLIPSSFGRRFTPIVAFQQYYYELIGARRNVGQTNMPMYLYAQKRFSLHTAISNTGTILLYYELCSQVINYSNSVTHYVHFKLTLSRNTSFIAIIK